MSNIPNSVLWIAGGFGFLGFILGSVRWKSEYAASEFDLRGAILLGLAFALGAGSMALTLSTDAWIDLWPVAIALVLLLMRFPEMLGFVKVMTAYDLPDGITRVPGNTFAERLIMGERMYRRAGFARGKWRATRSLHHDGWNGDEGMDAETFGYFNAMLNRARDGHQDVILFLLRELPGESERPALVVVRDAANVRKIQVDGDNITCPGVPTFTRQNVTACINYGFRPTGSAG